MSEMDAYNRAYGNDYDDGLAFMENMFKSIGIIVCLAIGWMIGYAVIAHYKTKPYYNTPANEIVVRHQQLGTIVKVSNCYTHKYDYSCYINTDTGIGFETSFGDWPTENLSVGDAIYFQYKTAAGNQFLSYCAHDRCMYSSHYFKGDRGYRDIYEKVGP